MEKIFKHSGCLGDIIYALPAVEHLGGGQFLIQPNNRTFRRPVDPRTCKLMCELLETQPYITSAEVRTKTSPQYTHSFDTFRDYLLYGRHLVKTHWLTLDIKEDCSWQHAWFNIEPLRKAPIVISRTHRRHGLLDWELLKPYKEHCLFIGLEQELANIPFEVPYYKINDFVEYAKIIAGANLVIANQTFTFALAEAMKRPRVLEYYIVGPNCLPTEETGGYLDLTEELINESISSPNVSGLTSDFTATEHGVLCEG